MKFRFLLCASLALGFIRLLAAEARPFLSPIFGDNMVLQRGKPNTFWGWAKPGEKVHVAIADHAGDAVAGADGRWQARVDPLARSECAVVIDGARHRELHHVLVGDVWLCGGQSNMQFGLPGANDGAKEVAAADQPAIRLFTVAARSAYREAGCRKAFGKFAHHRRSPKTAASPLSRISSPARCSRKPACRLA
jgi:sialate O-acetylesterase